MVRKGTCTAWYQDTVCRCTSENKSGVMLTQVTGTCWWSSEISIARTGAGSQNSLASFVYCLLPNDPLPFFEFLDRKNREMDMRKPWWPSLMRAWRQLQSLTHFNLSPISLTSLTPISLTSLTHLPHISHSSPSHLSHTLSHLSPMSLTSLTHLPHISHPSPSHLSSISLSHSSPCRFWTLSASFTV